MSILGTAELEADEKPLAGMCLPDLVGDGLLLLDSAYPGASPPDFG